MTPTINLCSLENNLIERYILTWVYWKITFAFLQYLSIRTLTSPLIFSGVPQSLFDCFYPPSLGTAARFCIMKQSSPIQDQADYQHSRKSFLQSAGDNIRSHQCSSAVEPACYVQSHVQPTSIFLPLLQQLQFFLYLPCSQTNHWPWPQNIAQQLI